MMCPVMWVWNKLLCKVGDHPCAVVIPIEYTSFFSGGVQTIDVAHCCRCNKMLSKM